MEQILSDKLNTIINELKLLNALLRDIIGPHIHKFKEPGRPCTICGKTWAELENEKAISESQK